MRALALHRDVIVVVSGVWQTTCTAVRSEDEGFLIDSPVLPDELDALPSLLEQAGFPVSGLLATHGAGGELAEVGLPTDTALQVAVAMAADDRVNPHGVAGSAAIVADPGDPESKIGFGQHGGLGGHEQRPFLIAEGGGFARRVEPGPTCLVDIAPTVLRHLRMDHDDMDGRPLPLGA